MRQINCLLFALALPFAATAFGQVAEFSVDGGVSRLSNTALGSVSQGTSGYSLDGGFRLGFRITLNNWRYLGHEFGYAYNRTQLVTDNGDGTSSKQGMAIHQGFYDFLAYATPEGNKIRPFAAAGVQFSNYTPPGSSASYGQGSNKFGINYGGGVKMRVSEKFGIRLDVRQYTNGKPFGIQGNSGWIKQTEVSAGFGLYL